MDGTPDLPATDQAFFFKKQLPGIGSQIFKNHV
jgi:hypothetical protein